MNRKRDLALGTAEPLAPSGHKQGDWMSPPPGPGLLKAAGAQWHLVGPSSVLHLWAPPFTLVRWLPEHTMAFNMTVTQKHPC